MNDRQSHLDYIIEHPEDDLARLVYSDWLEENGMPERAELIRIQLVLYVPHPCPGTSDGRSKCLWCNTAEMVPDSKIPKKFKECARYSAFRFKEKELLKNHGERWASEELIFPCQIEFPLGKYKIQWDGIEVDAFMGGSGHISIRPKTKLWRWEWSRGFIKNIRTTSNLIHRYEEAIRRCLPDLVFVSISRGASG